MQKSKHAVMACPDVQRSSHWYYGHCRLSQQQAAAGSAELGGDLACAATDAFRTNVTR
jgi:hypothetical protein